ncbi:GNAT family N-acetyltransferase [Ferrimonas balearica]|uniref:GNAT family N-acetyltransferase n=1 Tax=Ferrimonas balearica TaxID=44012 RepID=UPI001C590373|nr:GNAT family N-acetyltransferase [Ferrimonas balearica]MBY6019525.1 GNAT family N-acetyltransferase [Halomonas denitrificans]MBW3141379.1 GNAT family N-acetyltransferase [Ferrimonas balearica]MBW3166455.1 GNAT family N-acetyltransferase [Ferrimonas balearica]MBY6096590.1 GNAT family N-acetyltransferase [Ferrimonas balearica]MBY6108423.1 GNAT family N-acetyltransferase [Ferrimonas balearica]
MIQQTIRPGTIEEVVAISQQIPEFNAPYGRDEYQRRLADTTHLIQVAEVQGELAGFKVGYQLDDGVFYSWMGGIVPDFRALGLASQMLAQQEQWATEQGYHSLKVKSRNRYATMVAMLLRHGYQIEAFEDKGETVADHRIHLHKDLKK